LDKKIAINLKHFRRDGSFAPFEIGVY